MMLKSCLPFAFALALLLMFNSPPLTADEVGWVKEEVVQQARLAVVHLETGPSSTSTGFFATADGLVVTSADQLEGLRRVRIVDSRGRVIDYSQLMVIDPSTNVAVLATNQKPPAFLEIHDQPVAAGSPCAAIFWQPDTRTLRTADGRLMARRQNLDFTETRFVDLWSVALHPSILGYTGGPVVTGGGKVAAMCHFSGGSSTQRQFFAVPEKSIAAALALAVKAQRSVAFPRVGEISGSQLPKDEGVMRGRLLLSRGDAAGALAQFQAAMKFYPENPMVMLKVAYCLGETGDNESARVLLEKIRRLHPNRWSARLMLGYNLLALGDTPAALQCFEGITQEAPMLARGWENLGSCLLDVGRKEAALAALKKSTELEPESISQWYTYARALEENGAFSEATQARAKAADLESLFFKIRYFAPKRP